MMRANAASRAWRALRIVVAAALALLAGTSAGAHPAHWVVANVEIRRDATFVADLFLDREFAPDRLGAGAPETPVEGLPSARELRRETFGLLAAVAIRFDGAPAAYRAEWVPPAKEEDLRLRIRGEVPQGARAVDVTNSIDGPWAVSVRFEGDERSLVAMLEPGEAMQPVEFRAGHAPLSAAQTAARFVGHGFTHILPLGLDHVLFVLGLFLLSTRLRPLLTQVTAFTVAHTVTLGLSIAGILRLSSSVVEPLIAASIVYVAVENLCRDKVGPARLALVFSFGLLHGLGFAGALADLGLPAGRRAIALVSFNVGVELGQLAVLAAAWLAVGWPFRERPWYRARVVVPASVAIAGVGLWWAVTRVLGI